MCCLWWARDLVGIAREWAKTFDKRNEVKHVSLDSIVCKTY
jgi:hypothetical protein